MNQQGSKKQREKIVRLFCLGTFDTCMWETGTMDQRILLQFIDLDRSILCKLLVQTTISSARLCKTFDKIRVCALVPLCKLTFPHAICHLCTKPIHYLGNVYASALFKKRQNQFGQCPKWWRKSVFFPGTSSLLWKRNAQPDHLPYLKTLDHFDQPDHLDHFISFKHMILFS